MGRNGFEYMELDKELELLQSIEKLIWEINALN